MPVLVFPSDYHKKQNTLAALRKKALDKNPDEFYFNMISSELQVRSLKHSLAEKKKTNPKKSAGTYWISMQRIVSCWQDGVHIAKKDKEEMMTEEQKKVMRTQDIKYVEMKRVAEAKVRFIVTNKSKTDNLHSAVSGCS